MALRRIRAKKTVPYSQSGLDELKGPTFMLNLSKTRAFEPGRIVNSKPN